MVASRMQPGAPMHHPPAAVEISPDLAPHLGFRHHVGLEADGSRKLFGLARQRLIVCRFHDPGKSAGLGVVAPDLFFGDETGEEIVRFL